MNDKKSLLNYSLKGKKVVFRGDLDVGDDFSDSDTDKLSTMLKSIQFLRNLNSKIILIGHRGRPEGKIDGKLSLLPVAVKLGQMLSIEIKFVYDIAGHEALEESEKLAEGQIMMLENLRFDGREEANDDSFARSLAGLGEIYVNEAFSSSHREHASVVGIPKYLNSFLGFHFSEEIENLNKVLENPKRPVVAIISGLKKDKLEYVKPFSSFADRILIAGRLPELLDVREIGKTELENELREPIVNLVNEGKVVVADLIQDKEDITLHSVEKFEEEISKAGTVVVGGPVGKYEDEGHRQGTMRVFEAVANNKAAFKVAGGGDTEQAIKLLGFSGKFDWISVGGGASLDYLANGTLPGIEAIN